MSVSLDTFIEIYIKTISVVRLKTPGIPSLGVLFFLPIPHPHRGRFLILTVKARPPKTRKEGGQGRFYTDNGFLTYYFCD
jgi:hypothetical protein